MAPKSSSSSTGKRTKSKRAGLLFSVSRLASRLRHHPDAIHGVEGKVTVRPASAVYITACLQYLGAEILELAGKDAEKHGHKNKQSGAFVFTHRNVDRVVVHDHSLRHLMRLHPVPMPVGSVASAKAKALAAAAASAAASA